MTEKSFSTRIVEAVVNGIENGDWRGRTFTVDDLWALAEQMELPRPEHNRSMGAVVMHLKRCNMIRRTGRQVRSKRDQDKLLTVWKAQ